MNSDQTLDGLAVEMFRIFSRAEYALKASGFHNGEGDAKANWDAFALALLDFFGSPATEELSNSINYLLDNPPNKQIVNDGKIQWNTSLPQENNDAIKLFIFIRRERNNLFHGGKFNGHWFSPGCSEGLYATA